MRNIIIFMFAFFVAGCDARILSAEEQIIEKRLEKLVVRNWETDFSADAMTVALLHCKNNPILGVCGDIRANAQVVADAMQACQNSASLLCRVARARVSFNRELLGVLPVGLGFSLPSHPLYWSIENDWLNVLSVETNYRREVAWNWVLNGVFEYGAKFVLALAVMIFGVMYVKQHREEKKALRKKEEEQELRRRNISRAAELKISAEMMAWRRVGDFYRMLGDDLAGKLINQDEQHNIPAIHSNKVGDIDKSPNVLPDSVNKDFDSIFKN